MSSQEKLSKQVENLAKLIERSFQNERKQSITTDYIQILQQEMKIEEIDEKIVQSIQSRHLNLQPHLTEIRWREFQDKVHQNEKQLEELRDEIDNVIIKAIGDKEVMKIEQAEKAKKRTAYYASETTKALREMDALKTECSTTENEIRNQITVEAATRRVKLNEIKNNLERQIMERNAEFFSEQNKCNELWKKLDNLKVSAKYKDKHNSRSNVMVFDNNHLNLANQNITVDNMELPHTPNTTNATERNVNMPFSKDIVPITNLSKEAQEMPNFKDDYAQFERNFFNDPTNMRPNFKSNSFNSKTKAEKTSPPDIDSISNESLPKPNVSLGEHMESDDWKFMDCDFDTSSTMNQFSNTCRKLPKIYRGKGNNRSYFHN